MRRSSRPSRPTPFLSHVLACLAYCGLWAAFAWCLLATLHDMTRRDCQLGIQAACADLRR